MGTELISPDDAAGSSGEKSLLAAGPLPRTDSPIKDESLFGDVEQVSEISLHSRLLRYV